MQFTYDAEANAAYISLSETARRERVESRVDDYGLVLDFDGDGVLVGIEVFLEKTALPERLLAAARAQGGELRLA